jgi:hypothetical protein
VSRVNANPRLVGGTSGWDAGGLDSIIEDSSSFCGQEMGDPVEIACEQVTPFQSIEDSSLARVEERTI